ETVVCPKISIYLLPPSATAIVAFYASYAVGIAGISVLFSQGFNLTFCTSMNTSHSNKITPDDLYSDYATEKVPESKTMGGWGIGMVNGALAFAVPGLITGLELGGALSFSNALWAYFFGGFFLAVLGSVTGLVGRFNRLSSCMTMKFVFGVKGSSLLNLAFALSLLGWFGVNMDLFSSIVQSYAQELGMGSPGLWQIEFVAGVVMTLTTICGFRIIEKLSSLLVPVMVLVILYLLFQSLSIDSSLPAMQASTEALSVGEAISAVVGSFIVSVVLMPDFTRFARSSGDALISSFFPYLVLCTFVYVVATIAGAAVQSTDVVEVFLLLGLGSFGLMLMCVSSWLTNVVNLYSSSLAANSVFSNIKEWHLISILGVLGTAVASLNLLDRFIEFLFGLAIIFTPVAAIYIVDFFVLRNKRCYELDELDQVPAIVWPAVMAWLFGVLVSLATSTEFFFISGVQAVDGLLATAVMYFLFSRHKRV
ncbi:MAG: cytosine permease, partial [Pseudohongiellaceae bacterium]